MISFKVDVDPIKTFILIHKVLSEVLIEDNDHFSEEERFRFQFPVHVK